MKRRTALLGAAWRAVLMALLLGTGAAVVLRDGAQAVALSVAPAVAPSATAAVYAGLLLLLHEIGALPLSWFGGFLGEQRYGLSEQALLDWMKDQIKSLLVMAVLGMCAAMLLYAVIRLFPEWWWAPAGLLFALLTAALAFVGPVLLLPLFYSVRRLEHESLTRRLLELAERTGTHITGVYEWSLSLKTRKANAALAGLGGTRRILVSDTMLASYSDDEVEVVLAHELGHHVHGDMWKGLVSQSAVLVVGFGVAAWAVGRAGPPLGLMAASDVAGLPLILLVSGAVHAVARPAQLALSRMSERRADFFALRATGNPGAFISAMRRLAAQNLAEPQPSMLVQWLFYSHPPIEDRIAAARSFQVTAPGQPMAAV